MQLKGGRIAQAFLTRSCRTVCTGNKESSSVICSAELELSFSSNALSSITTIGIIVNGLLSGVTNRHDSYVNEFNTTYGGEKVFPRLAVSVGRN